MFHYLSLLVINWVGRGSLGSDPFNSFLAVLELEHLCQERERHWTIGFLSCDIIHSQLDVVESFQNRQVSTT